MVSATRWAIRPSITTTPAVGPAVGPPSGAEVGAAVVGVVAANRPRVARRSTMGRTRVPNRICSHLPATVTLRLYSAGSRIG
jgi:hypothetical protein